MSWSVAYLAIRACLTTPTPTYQATPPPLYFQHREKRTHTLIYTYRRALRGRYRYIHIHANVIPSTDRRREKFWQSSDFWNLSLCVSRFLSPLVSVMAVNSSEEVRFHVFWPTAFAFFFNLSCIFVFFALLLAFSYAFRNSACDFSYLSAVMIYECDC